jgi:hypothetical protein
VSPRIVRAQTIPVSVAQAEAEAAGFPRADSISITQPRLAKAPFAGTADRRCVPATAPDPRGSGSLRSGDIVVRGTPSELTAGKRRKILWLPLHGSGASRATRLIVRADRVGSPGDSVRFSVAGLAYTPGPPTTRLYSYPSEVTLPAPGEWIVVATAGPDWGCFVVDVSEATAKAR